MCLGRGSSESPLSSESFIHSTSFLGVNISCSVSSRRRPNARTWCIFNTVYPTIWFWLLVQLLSRVLLFETLWTAAHWASLSFTISQSLLKLMSIESVMPCNHLSLSPRFPPALNLSQHQGLFQKGPKVFLEQPWEEKTEMKYILWTTRSLFSHLKL